VLPIILACAAAMTLKPLVRWAGWCHIPAGFSAAVILCLLISAVGIGFFQLSQPASRWINDAPQHMTDLRQRFQKLFPRGARISEATAAVKDLGATKAEKAEEQKQAPSVEVRDSRGTGSLLNWTGTLLAGIGETVVLLYLLLASGDLFLQKLVHVMPTLSDKKRAVEISHEIQENIAHYLFAVTLINLGLGLLAGVGLYFIGVPNAAMWGIFVAVVNFVPYFGPFVGVVVLAAVGLLTFDTLGKGLLPPVWYGLLHLVEANFITPMLLGRRFTLNSLIFWTWLWGVPGALLSLPILVSLKVVCDRVPAMSSISELLTSEAKLPKRYEPDPI
jgi:predicted PurR-regulated permease PerM